MRRSSQRLLLWRQCGRQSLSMPEMRRSKPPLPPIAETQFARQRNDEIDASINAVSVEHGREYVRELNARADADRADAREAEFARARNAEIDGAIAASQDAAFARARNAEAEASIAAVNAQRVLLDTGSITTATPVEHPLQHWRMLSGGP